MPSLGNAEHGMPGDRACGAAVVFPGSKANTTGEIIRVVAGIELAAKDRGWSRPYAHRTDEERSSVS